MSEIPGTGISIDYELSDPPARDFVLTMYGPAVMLKQFSSPSEVLISFMMNLEAAGLSVASMESTRVQINAGTGIFALTWAGQVLNDNDTVKQLIGQTTAALGIEA